MPGYKGKPKKGKKPNKRHPRSSSSSPRRGVSPTLAQLREDPECAYLLCAARETSIPELAAEYRQTAARVWRERHPSPARVPSPIRVSVPELYGETGTSSEGELGEDSPCSEEEGTPPHRDAAPTPGQLERDPQCAALLKMARETSSPEWAVVFRQEAVRGWLDRHVSPPHALSSRKVDTCTVSATASTPEEEFGEGDSPGEGEEQEEVVAAYPPSVDDASTVDYGGEGVDYPPSLDDASTVDYGGEGADYPPVARRRFHRRLRGGGGGGVRGGGLSPSARKALFRHRGRGRGRPSSVRVLRHL
ncbi:uncharacterized protein LOC143515106 isoform X2 [Brachyhypopomus gauderio]|uniref:uncharacterized protein LOC143515106 isoform X2 n=1 Tax=Brachyhypopomus gauderio TaxID=698409 RepID=UPI0040430E08